MSVGPRRKISTSRGLRQGDLSLFLFIVVVDVLSRLVSLVVMKKRVAEGSK